MHLFQSHVEKQIRELKGKAKENQGQLFIDRIAGWSISISYFEGEWHMCVSAPSIISSSILDLVASLDIPKGFRYSPRIFKAFADKKDRFYWTWKEIPT